jgi:dCMP deaminase
MNELDWDLYFLRLAREVSKNSKCMSRKIGAVLVKDKNVVSTGYNGAAKGVLHCEMRPIEFYNDIEKNYGGIEIDEGDVVDICPRRLFGYKSGKGLHLCQAAHAERNAINQAAKNGISTKGASLYCYCPLPCCPCMIEIINSGIKRLVYLKANDYDIYSRVLLKESKMEYTEYEETEIL